MNKPLINYYAKLINRGDYEMDKVPDDMKEAVKDKIDELNQEKESEDVSKDE